MAKKEDTAINRILVVDDDAMIIGEYVRCLGQDFEPDAAMSTLGDLEKVLFGVTHAEAGAYVLGLWKIPPVIVEAVLMHQQPGRLSFGSWSPLTAVHVADALLNEYASGNAPCPGV